MRHIAGPYDDNRFDFSFHSWAIVAVVLILLFLAVYSSVSILYPDHKGSNPAWKFTNETRVRECPDERTWGEGKRMVKIWKAGEVKR